MKIGSITHEELIKAIADAARKTGWKVAGFRTVSIQRQGGKNAGSVYYETPVRFDGKGWPDLMLFREPEILALEVKVGKDKLKPEQLEWLQLMARCGVHCLVVREQDWIDGTILGVLA